MVQAARNRDGRRLLGDFVVLIFVTDLNISRKGRCLTLGTSAGFGPGQVFDDHLKNHVSNEVLHLMYASIDATRSSQIQYMREAQIIHSRPIYNIERNDSVSLVHTRSRILLASSRPIADDCDFIQKPSS
jgi:hypothetical protein